MKQSRGQNIAIIGAGISGLSAAHYLCRHHRITLFEAADRIGGHTATVLVDGRVLITSPFATGAAHIRWKDLQVNGSVLTGDELLLAVADKVCPAHLFECFPEQRPVVRVMITQEGLVKFALRRRRTLLIDKPGRRLRRGQPG